MTSLLAWSRRPSHLAIMLNRSVWLRPLQHVPPRVQRCAHLASGTIKRAPWVGHCPKCHNIWSGLTWTTFRWRRANLFLPARQLTTRSSVPTSLVPPSAPETRAVPWSCKRRASGACWAWRRGEAHGVKSMDTRRRGLTHRIRASTTGCVRRQTYENKRKWTILYVNCKLTVKVNSLKLITGHTGPGQTATAFTRMMCDKS